MGEVTTAKESGKRSEREFFYEQIQTDSDIERTRGQLLP